MKTKRVLSALLALMILISCLAGCGYNPEVVMTVGDVEIPAGVFLMLQLSAYYNAVNKVSGELLADMTVLDTIIEEKPARDWINDETDRLVKEYAYIESEFTRLELEMDDMTVFYAEYYAQSSWESDSALYQKNGISYDSLLAVNYNTMKRSQLMEFLYGEGGENEIPQEDLEAYYYAHYARADTLTFPKVNTGGTALTDEERQQMHDIAQQMLAAANSRDMEQAFLRYYESVLRLTGEIHDHEEGEELEEDHINEEEIVINSELFSSTAKLDVLVHDRETTFPEGFYAELLAAADNGYYLYVEEGGVIVLYRRNEFKEDDSYENVSSSILVYMAQDPFSEAYTAGAAALEMNQNDRARRHYSLDNVKLS